MYLDKRIYVYIQVHVFIHPYMYSTSSVMLLYLGPKIFLASASAVEVLPVPGGPEIKNTTISMIRRYYTKKETELIIEQYGYMYLYIQHCTKLIPYSSKCGSLLFATNLSTVYVCACVVWRQRKIK